MAVTEAELILERLAQLAREIEYHKAAQYLLEVECDELRMKLRATGWKPAEREALESR